MDGYHPTVEGTKVLLQAIHEQVPIIVDGKFIVSDRLYQGVVAVFRYDCLTCRGYLELDINLFCPKCLLPATPLYNSISMADVEMGIARNKRLLCEDGEIPCTPAKKIQ